MSSINAAFALYFAACLMLFTGEIFKRRMIGIMATTALFLGIVSNLIAVALRWRATGHPPLSNMHESLVFIALSIATISFVAQSRYKVRFIGAFSSVLAVMAIGYASILDRTVQPLLPALKSNWLIIHVTAYFIGYGAVAVASVAAAVYIVLAYMGRSNEGTLRLFDVLSFRLILLAFPFLTIGLTTGAVWANVAWGRYWGWDPKETWSLITWLIYSLYLHLRTMRGWQGKRTAMIAVVGFVFVLFTFLGVNFLLGGLHSYR